MNDVESRLMRCVASIFPALSEEEIRSLNIAELMAVDSLAAVTLVSLLDEEFAVDFDLEELLTMGSFDSLRGRLRGISADKIDSSRSTRQ